MPHRPPVWELDARASIEKTNLPRQLEDCNGDPDREDQYVCARLHEIRLDVMQFVWSLCAETLGVSRCNLASLLNVQNRELIRYMDRFALARSEEDWRQLLLGADRLTLMVAIIGQVLRHEIFDNLYYGSREEQWEILRGCEIQMMHADGFERASVRALTIRDFMAEDGAYERLKRVQAKTALQLWLMLEPLSASRVGCADQEKKTFLTRLVGIVGKAATLSREMRRQHGVVYHWPSTFKDEIFDTARMDCLNLDRHLKTSPYQEVQMKENQTTWVALDKDDEAQQQKQSVVNLVCFPGLMAYRKGGGPLASRKLEEEKGMMTEESELDLETESKKGIRNRILAKAVVSLKWGNQRLLTKEAGTSVHLRAMKSGDMSRYTEDPATQGVMSLQELLEKQSLSGKS